MTSEKTKQPEQGNATTTPTEERALTGEEKALYDRQIRLWGVEAQRKLASSHVLMIGDPTDVLVQEIAKNIVLAGIARLVILRLHEPNNENGNEGVNIRPGFLGSDDDSVIKTLQSMNPLVDINVIRASNKDVSVEGYRVVCTVGLTPSENMDISVKTRTSNISLLCGRVAGEVGWVFIDNCDDQYTSFTEAFNSKWGGEVRRGEFGWHVTRTLLEFQLRFNGRLPAAPVSNDDENNDLSQVERIYNELTEKFGGAHQKTDVVVRAAKAAKYTLPPVASIVGGLWGREVVKVIAGREKPLDGFNFFFFNAATSKGSVEKVGLKR